MSSRATSICFLSTMIVTGCGPGLGRPGTEDVTLRAIEQDIRLTRCDLAPPQLVATTQALTGGTTYENEVHDCQRLVIRQAAGYVFGPLVGIFPLDTAMQLDTMAFTQPRIVASIYNWGDFNLRPQPYEPLGIQPGWQCLWLRHDNGTWAAAVTPVVNVPCDSPTSHAAPQFSQLTVQEFNHDSAQAANPAAGFYPATARWGWDSVHAQHYIGIKCGTAWCAIGDSAFTPREVNPLTGPRERSIPGWYDEQHVAVHDRTDPLNPVLRPGPWATIYPDSALARRFPPNFQNVAVDVAHIEVIQDPADPVGFAHYVRRFHLHVSGGIGRVTMHVAVPNEHSTTGQAEFRQRTTGSKRPAATFKRMPGVLHAAPGAARWRWHENPGETGWYWCGGCCDGSEAM